MYKIIGVFLFACFFAAETRYTFPVKLEKNQDAPSATAENKISYRLPDSVIPLDYDIALAVYLDENNPKKFTFDGIVDINVKVVKPVKSITLHSDNLDITKIKLLYNSTYDIPISFTTENSTNFLNIVKYDGIDVATGKYTLKIEYKGKLNDDLRGFYRSHYINDKKEKVWLAATHFEPVGARRAFPCFDEPQYKTPFSMKITHLKKFKAIFNTQKKTKTFKNDNGIIRADELVTTEFETTPPMSTYLLAFVVSDFEPAKNSAKNFTVYARPNAIQHGNLAVEKGKQILDKLEAFTDIPFETKIGKMDQIAIPQFTAGAMENWGLVTYREQSLLYNKENSSTAEKQSIIETIAHEFAHQWFGDLVSPKWWKYLWLNEGFANFFQSYITEQVETDWRSVEQSVVNSIQKTAFKVDSSENTHPINVDVESPKEISSIFDNISYQKGGAVIRMMQHYLTDETFKQGLRKYLKDNQYKAAGSDDLFKSIQDVLDKLNKSDIKIKDVMDAWVNKKGYPVVNVKINYEKKNMILTQERFFTYNASAEERKNNLWQIPVNYATQNNPDFKNTSAQILFSKSTDTVPVDGLAKDHWVILNKQQTGFYRVNYDEANWKLIINYLKSTNRENIHPLNRAQLMNDALAFVKEEMLDLQILLQLTAYLKNETDYIAWTPAFDAFSYLNSKLVNSEHYPIFKKYVLDQMASLIASVGLEETEKDDHIKKLNRIQTMSLACSLGYNECISNMEKKLIDWLNNEKNTIISKDLRKITFCHGLRNASHALWEKVFNKTKTHEDYSEKLVMIGALGCSNNDKVLTWYLHYALSNETKENLQNVILNVLNNDEVGTDVVLDFIVPNIFKLYWKLDNKKILQYIINSIGQKITTKTQLKKFKAITELNVQIPDDLITEAVNFAERNLEWLQKHNKTLSDQFSKDSKKGKGGVGAITSSIGLLAFLSIFLLSNNL